jgi:hypothetical protein
VVRDDDRTTQIVHADGNPFSDDSPEATIIERVRLPVPTAGAPIHQLDYPSSEGTVRIEPGSPWGAAPSPANFTAPAPQPHARLAMPEMRPAPASSPPLPGWVLPYMIACITLVLVGAFVLWNQARALGHF